VIQPREERAKDRVVLADAVFGRYRMGLRAVGVLGAAADGTLAAQRVAKSAYSFSLAASSSAYVRRVAANAGTKGEKTRSTRWPRSGASPAAQGVLFVSF